MNALLPMPAFEPERSLGWRDIGLDGLSCYLRCVEAILHIRGYRSPQIARALAEPLNLIRPEPTGGPFGDFPLVTVRWQVAEPGATFWPVIRDALTASGPPHIVCPDGYWWPSDGYHKSAHAHHHMVLPVRFDDGVLEMLDTDTTRESGYTRRSTMDSGAQQAFDRIATVESAAPPPAEAPEEAAARLLPASLDALANDIGELEGFLAAWDGGSMPAISAQGLHVVVLGDFQPQLFLLRCALGEGADALDRVRAALTAAAGHAKKLGLLLTGLHRFLSDDLYAVTRYEFETFVRSLWEVHSAIRDYLGVTADPPSSRPPHRFAQRWAAVTGWCFGKPATTTTTDWITGLPQPASVADIN